MSSLNEVRPRRPEQSGEGFAVEGMGVGSLNEVRPRRPEQSQNTQNSTPTIPVSMKSGLEGRNNKAHAPSTNTTTPHRLNGVRPRWPEQYNEALTAEGKKKVSMESGLDGRNNLRRGWAWLRL